MFSIKPAGEWLTRCDLHVHTEFSFDGDKDGLALPDRIADEAIKHKLDTIALCDHCDIDDILDGIYPPYPADEIYRAVTAVREKYAGQLEILYGIELGQPHARPEESKQLLDKYNFDFVIGSLHNLKNYPDFCFLRYDVMTYEHIDLLVRRSIDELCEVARFSGISTLAHINYIGRYMKKCGVSFDFMKYERRWRELFHIVIEQGIALEVNTSGLTQDGGETMPNEELLRLYYDCGGRILTLGSDAHRCDRLANGSDRAADMLRDIGFIE